MSLRSPVGWVDLIVARNEPEAHLIAGILQDSGISARLDTGRYTMGAGMYGAHNPMEPVAIMVEVERVEEARAVLAETELAATESSPLPEEEEQDVAMLDAPRLDSWRRIVKWVAAAIAIFFLLSYVVDNPLLPWR
jgi:hypothetical protein